MATEALEKLSSELERQADKYHRGLGVQKDIIMRLLTERPRKLPKMLSIAVVTLGTSIDPKRQADFAGLNLYYDLSLGHDTAGGVTYGEPHLIWMHDGHQILGKSVENVRKSLPRNTRPSTQLDGISLSIVYEGFRNALKSHVIDLPGTAVGAVGAPYLDDWLGVPRLYHGFVGGAHPYDGSALSGS